MTCTMHLTQELRERGFRMTPQRQVILQILHDIGGHLSPKEIYGMAINSIPGLTETTVYRTLEFLSQNEMINPSQNSNGHLVYEIAGNIHHHIICRSCGDTIEINHSLFEDLFSQLKNQSGYQIDSSHLTLFGLCPKCQPIDQ